MTFYVETAAVAYVRQEWQSTSGRLYVIKLNVASFTKLGINSLAAGKPIKMEERKRI